MAQFRAVQPVIEVSDVEAAVRWYCDCLGFTVSFRDPNDPDHYVGLVRDGIEIHLQWHHPTEWETCPNRPQYRFVVDDPDDLLAEFQQRSAAFDGRQANDTAWGTREFGQYDPDRNALLFYRDLAEPGSGPNDLADPILS